ncbi:peptidylprolyl isomerase [Lacinutrix salivirga]
MLRYLLFIAFIFLLNCEDKQTKQKTNTNPKIETIDTLKTVEKDSVVTDSTAFVQLTSETAMDFFLEYEKENKETRARIVTAYGDIEIKLFNNTKFHRANFVFLTKEGAFDGTQFHRVVKNFIIQGGNTDDIEIARRRIKIGRYLLPPDTKRGYKHHRGVISMPSSDIDNPHQLASPYEFFIVQKDAYHLDGDYTIFGRVTKGMDVVDEINAQETDGAQWPLHNVYIKKVEIIE